MGKITKITVAAACLGFAGCVAKTENTHHDPGASSLVYSPAARVQADAAATRPARVAGLQTGRRCRVHLRRDAVGLAGQAPLSMLGTSAMAERATVSGTLERVDDDGVTLRAENSTYWIPRGVILAVEFPDQP
jgi:hypothetical protein